MNNNEHSNEFVAWCVLGWLVVCLACQKCTKSNSHYMQNFQLDCLKTCLGWPVPFYTCHSWPVPFYTTFNGCEMVRVYRAAEKKMCPPPPTNFCVFYFCSVLNISWWNLRQKPFSLSKFSMDLDMWYVMTFWFDDCCLYISTKVFDRTCIQVFMKHLILLKLGMITCSLRPYFM